MSAADRKRTLGGGSVLLIGALLAPGALLAAETSEGPLDLGGALVRAAQENPSVHAARERIQEARAGVRASRADRIPDLELLDDHMYTNRVFPNFFQRPEYTHQLSATLRQRIFSAGALSAGVKLAHGVVEEAEATYHQVLEEVLERVTVAYLDVLQEQETQEVLQDSIATHERRIADIQAKIDAGVMLETDRLQADIQLLEDQRALLVSRTGEALARDSLDVLLRLPDGAHPELTGELAPLSRIDADRARRDVPLDGSPALAVFRARIEQARARVRIARAAYKPSVDVQVSQNHVANGLSVFSRDANFLEALGSIRLPLFDGGRRDAELQGARRGERATRLEARAQRDDLTIQAGQAVLGIEEAQARLETSATRIRLATRNREIVQDRYLQGTAIQAELLDADVAYRRARLDEITSRFDILRNIARVLRLSGRLTGTALAGRADIEDPMLLERVGPTSSRRD